MTDTDAAAVLAVHRGWLAANIGLVAESMIDFFPTGLNYLQFNLNGFTYNGVEDKAKLWRNLQAVGANIVRIDDVGEPVVEVFGDVALLTSEGECEIELPSPSGVWTTRDQCGSATPSSIAATMARVRLSGASGTCMSVKRRPTAL